MDKVFEKCLEHQLIQYFNPILSPSLSAYRRGYSCESVLLQPTRVTSTLSTLINVILTNKPRSFLASGVFDLGLSDHHLIYAVTRSHCPRSCPRTVIKRHFKNFDPELFCQDLSMVPFDVAYIFDDVDDISWAWSTLVSGVLDVHAPCLFNRFPYPSD